MSETAHESSDDASLWAASRSPCGGTNVPRHMVERPLEHTAKKERVSRKSTGGLANAHVLSPLRLLLLFFLKKDKGAEK